MNERIEKLISLEKNLGDFAKKVGQHRSTIANLIDRGSIPSGKVLQSIIENYPKLNAKWLLIGEGEMWLDDKNSNPQTKAVGDEKSLAEQLDIANDTIKNLNDLISLLKYNLELAENRNKRLENKIKKLDDKIGELQEKVG